MRDSMRKIKLKQISENYDKLASPNPNAKLRASIGMENSMGEFFYLNIDDLATYEKQARKHFNTEELNQLAETIKEHGIRQPLSVIKTEESGIYQVISGERRLRAARLAGLEKVPCIILPETAQTEEIAVIENIQRSDLHPIELSNAYTSLLRNFNHGDKSQLARKIGVSNSHVSEILSLAKLPEEIKEHLLRKNIRTRATLRKLVNCQNTDQMNEHLGIEKSKETGSKRKFIYTFFIKNGELGVQINNYKLTDKQKLKIKEQLQNLIDSIDV